MSRENVEVVRRISSLWQEGAENGDPGAMQAPFDEGLLAPDSTFTPQDVAGASGRTYVGLEGLREFIRGWTEDWVDWRVEVEAIVDSGDDRVVATGYQSATGKRSGAFVEIRYGMVFTLREGQVVDHRHYRSRAEALKAVGLQE
jgi:ketosteroid isomerase-like protein